MQARVVFIRPISRSFQPGVNCSWRWLCQNRKYVPSVQHHLLPKLLYTNMIICSWQWRGHTGHLLNNIAESHFIKGSRSKKSHIEEVEGSIPWMSPVVIVPKPKTPTKTRLWVDMRAPNKVIWRERHITPTVDGIIAQPNGSTVSQRSI